VSAALLALDLPDESATLALAGALAAVARRGDVIALSGPLGSGKTVFARGFIAARLGAAEVPSPTFTLVETYQPVGGPSSIEPPVWHFDLYRLEAPDEAYELGIEEAFADGITLIEWPERLGGLLPHEHLGIALDSGASATSRIARVDASHSWASRLAGIIGE
jgi:tRNA threonylcarbamoyl adenosine modification protein YjeE